MVKVLGYLAVLVLASVAFGYPMLGVSMLLLFLFACLMSLLAHGVYSVAGHNWFWRVLYALAAVVLIATVLYLVITGMVT